MHILSTLHSYNVSLDCSAIWHKYGIITVIFVTMEMKELYNYDSPGLNQWVVFSTMVPLNYNFIFTCMDTRDATQYFACQMPKFPMVFYISTRHDVALPGVVFTQDVAFTRDGIMTFPHRMVVLTKLNNWQDLSCF